MIEIVVLTELGIVSVIEEAIEQAIAWVTEAVSASVIDRIVPATEVESATEVPKAVTETM